MKPKPIVVLGSSNTDMIIQLPRLPKPGETLLGGRFTMAAGGKGANQAVAAARAGGRVAFIAKLGADMFGEKALEGFKREGIDVSAVARDKRYPSGVALIFVARDGQNCIAVASGANARLDLAYVRKHRALIRRAAVLVLQLETPLPAVQAAARIAAEGNVPIILNPAPARRLPDSLLSRVTILTPNESEAELLSGKKLGSTVQLNRAADVLLARGVKAVVITLGKRGAFVAAAGIRKHVPAFKVKAVDATAAGDVFNGVLAVAMSEGRPLLEAVKFANAAAAISVTRLGAQPSAPCRSEIEQFLAKQQSL